MAFGRGTKAFEPDFKPVPSKTSLDPKVPTRKEKGAFGSAYYASDANGREYFMPVTISYNKTTGTGTASAISGSIGGEQVTGAATEDTFSELIKVALPNPVISIRNSKNIIETALTERGGKVIELTNINNYDITIRGFCIGNNEWPEAQVQQLKEIFTAGDNVRIDCVLTDIFLNELGRMAVVASFDVPEVRGVKYVRPYELKLISDTPFSLYEI